MSLRIKITFESKRALTLHRRNKTRIWCRECKAEADFIKDDEISVLLPKLNGTVNYEELHKYQSIDGKTMICLASLFKN